MNRNGFTLLEFLFVIAVMFVLITIGIPLYKDSKLKLEIKAQANAFHSLIYLARTEAIKRSHVVTICKSNDSEICGGTWSDGWLMFADKNEDGVLDVVDEVIISGNIENSVNVKWSAFGSENYIRLTPRGLMLAQNGTFTICPQNGNHSIARTVVVSKLARVRLPDSGLDAGGDLIICN